MIDVHAHTLQCSAHAVQDAQDAGVQHVVSVSETLAEARELLTVANVCPCIGVHPVQPVMVQGQRTGVRSVTLEDLEGWGRVWEQGKMRFVGIGEVGLDFSPHVLGSSHNTLGRDKCKEIQKEVFRRQIKEALAKDLPLNVHSRQAGHHAIDVLRECDAKRVILHAFDGKPKYVKLGVSLGYFFSIPPSSVFDEQFQKLIDIVPIEHLLLETDAPALGPDKSTPNVPANLSTSVQVIARIKQLEIEEVIQNTTRNALSFHYVGEDQQVYFRLRSHFDADKSLVEEDILAEQYVNVDMPDIELYKASLAGNAQDASLPRSLPTKDIIHAYEQVIDNYLKGEHYFEATQTLATLVGADYRISSSLVSSFLDLLLTPIPKRLLATALHSYVHATLLDLVYAQGVQNFAHIITALSPERVTLRTSDSKDKRYEQKSFWSWYEQAFTQAESGKDEALEALPRTSIQLFIDVIYHVLERDLCTKAAGKKSDMDSLQPSGAKGGEKSKQPWINQLFSRSMTGQPTNLSKHIGNLSLPLVSKMEKVRSRLPDVHLDTDEDSSDSDMDMGGQDDQTIFSTAPSTPSRAIQDLQALTDVAEKVDEAESSTDQLLPFRDMSDDDMGWAAIQALQKVLRLIVLFAYMPKSGIDPLDLSDTVARELSSLRRDHCLLILQTFPIRTFQLTLLENILQQTDTAKIPKDYRKLASAPLSAEKLFRFYLYTQPLVMTSVADVLHHVKLVELLIVSWLDGAIFDLQTKTDPPLVDSSQGADQPQVQSSKHIAWIGKVRMEDRSFIWEFAIAETGEWEKRLMRLLKPSTVGTTRRGRSEKMLPMAGDAGEGGEEIKAIIHHLKMMIHHV